MWKEPSEPAAAKADLREGLGQGREVVDLPEAEEPALESVAEFLGHAMDVSMQIIEEEKCVLQGGGASCARAGGAPQRLGGGIQ